MADSQPMNATAELTDESDADAIDAPEFEYASPAQKVPLEVFERESPGLIIPGSGYVRHDAGQVTEKSGADNTATYRIVTRQKEPNRNGNTIQILPGPNGQGMKTDRFNATTQSGGIVLYNHGEISLPVGWSTPPKLQSTKATATARFSNLPHAEPIAAAVHEGLLGMASIGFIVELAMRLKRPKETLPEDVESVQWYGYDFTQIDLMEWSVVPIGADPGALRQTIERGSIAGVKVPAWLKQSWSTLAEQPKAWAPGVTFKRQEIESLGVTIEGPEDRIAAAVARLEQAQAQATAPVTEENSAVTQETHLDAGTPCSTTAQVPQVDLVSQIAEAFREQAPVDYQPVILEVVSQCLKDAVSESLKPVAAASEDFDRKLQTALGRRVTAQC
jgi:hypothetical protein